MGGENIIYQITPFVPLELVVKATRNLDNFKDSLIENHFIKMIYDEMYTCKVFEEIIIYDKEKKEVIAAVTIVERALQDVEQLVKVWNKKEQLGYA